MLWQRCSKCKQRLLLSVFGRNKATPTGKQAYCKVCNRQYQREYRAANRAEVDAYQQRYRQTHKAEAVARRKKYNEEYCQTHKTQIAEYQRKYYLAHRGATS